MSFAPFSPLRSLPRRRNVPFSPLSLSPLAWHVPELGVRTSAGAAFQEKTSRPTLTSTHADFAVGGVSFGWAGWVRIRDTSGAQVVVGKGSTPGGYQWAVYLNQAFAGSVSFIGYTLPGSGAAATWGSALTAGQWYHVAVWRDQAAGKNWISVNGGTPVSATTANPASGGTAPLRFSGWNDPGTYFIGDVGPNGYWNRALLTADLTALYNGGAALKYSSLAAGQLSGLVAYYDFDSTGNLTADRTGGGHTLTNTNAVQVGAGPVKAAAADTQAVTDWLDQGTGTHDLLAAPGGSGLVFVAGAQNGRPMLQADGTYSYLICDALAALISGSAVPWSFFTVVKGMTVNAAYQQLFCADTIPAGTNDPVTELGYAGDTTGHWATLTRGNSGGIVATDAGTPDTAAHQLAMLFDGANISHYVDGTLAATAAWPGTAMTLNRWTLGSHRSPTLGPIYGVFTGKFGETLLLPSVPDAGTLTKVFSYFRSGWGTP